MKGRPASGIEGKTLEAYGRKALRKDIYNVNAELERGKLEQRPGRDT